MLPVRHSANGRAAALLETFFVFSTDLQPPSSSGGYRENAADNRPALLPHSRDAAAKVHLIGN